MDPRTTYARRDEVQLVDNVPDRLDQIDRDRPVVTVCRSGRRSGQVAGYLNKAGFTADNMTGGFDPTG